MTEISNMQTVTADAAADKSDAACRGWATRSHGRLGGSRLGVQPKL